MASVVEMLEEEEVLLARVQYSGQRSARSLYEGIKMCRNGVIWLKICAAGGDMPFYMGLRSATTLFRPPRSSYP